MKAALLNEYARLVVRIGANVQPGQPVVISAPVEGADFARRLVREAYEAGAGEVVLNWSDEETAHLRFKMADNAVFDIFPRWRRLFFEDWAAADAAFISIHAENPEMFSDVAPDRLRRSQQASGEALEAYRTRLMSNKNAWCIVAIPSPGWAQKVFPDQSQEAAVASLWQAIAQAVRVDGSGQAVARWREHITFLRRAADFLNRSGFASLHYTNDRGTDLVVGLPEGHIWVGGEEATQPTETHPGGVPFIANMPTEEVYTLPDRGGVEGVVMATRPLVYQGNLIEGMKLTFRAGRVVDFDAVRGKALLGELLQTDEGAAHLGEVALVPFDSPISKSGILFYNTLFDENASCHLALGRAYPTCLRGGAAMDSLTLLAHGANDSLVHEDFMIGSEDLSITGRTKEGKEIPVFRQGNFVSF